MNRTVLLLGGTAEARALAVALDGTPGLRLVSSLAGRVRDPRLPVGEVRVGGFGGPDGLASWLRDAQVTAVVDATHPFAERIGASAETACRTTGTPLVRLQRPGWTAGPGDDWRTVGSLPAAAALLPSLGARVFLTTGRQGLAAFRSVEGCWFLVRCVDPPAPEDLPAEHELLLARGPYAAEAEVALMASRRIDVLVTKDSGGPLTEGKLAAARQLGLPVVVVARPTRPDVDTVTTVEAAAAWVRSL